MTGTQHAYDASLEQCIGRALRYGQTKAVHIYRFLALHTYDVDVIQNRERKTLVRGKVDPSYTPFGYTAPAVGADGGWSLVAEDGVGAEMEAGWASGV